MYKLAVEFKEREEFLAFIAAFMASCASGSDATLIQELDSPALVHATNPIGTALEPAAKAPAAKAPMETPPPASRKERKATVPPAASVTVVEQPAPTPVEVSVQAVTDMAIKKSAHNMPAIRECLGKYNVRKIVDLDPKDLPAVYAVLCALPEGPTE